jgi:endonuclease-3
MEFQLTGKDIPEAVRKLRKVVAGFREPAVEEIAKGSREPYKILVSCLISLRTKEEVTRKSSKRLFALADTPERMLKRDVETISKAIYPAGFYKTKAERILEISGILIERYGGEVPSTKEELLQLPGVGSKTASLVLGVGYGKPAICVDTHVHRISNRWGLVETKTPEETEKKLEAFFNDTATTEIYTLLVKFGQNLCVPISPFCSRCPLSGKCPRIGVTRRR